jgi:hypothetical protein
MPQYIIPKKKHKRIKMTRVMLIIEHDIDAHGDDTFTVEYAYGNYILDPSLKLDVEDIQFCRIEGEFYDADRVLDFIKARMESLGWKSRK